MGASGFSRVQNCSLRVTGDSHKKRKCDHYSTNICSSDDKRRKTKWSVEPFLSQMREALWKVRVDKVSTTDVSRDMGIPTRTLRRYVNFSKNPADNLFFIEVQEEEDDKDDEDNCPVISWRPRTAVPMFRIDERRPAKVPFAKFQDIPKFEDVVDNTFAAEDLLNSTTFDELFADFNQTFNDTDNATNMDHVPAPEPLLRGLSSFSCGSLAGLSPAHRVDFEGFPACVPTTLAI